MDYPFVAVRSGLPHWPHCALFVTTRGRRQFSNNEPLGADQQETREETA
jgi:hypothetical protein